VAARSSSPATTVMRSAVGVAVLVMAVVATVLLVRGNVFAGDPALAGVVRDPPPEVTGLTFLDHGATPPREVDLVPAPGQLRLVYFGYLSCPDVCPMTMADVARARRELGPSLASRTSVAFVTVDPERDDPDRLRGYLTHFFDEAGMPLTAVDQAGLDAAAERLGVRYAIEPHEPGDDRYDVDHSAITYVIDDTGTVVRELPFGVTPDELVQVMRALLP
jgi:protein SCO1